MIAWIVPFFAGKRQGRGRFSSAPLRLSINLTAEGLGGKDSVKENRQGCLSRPGRPLFEPFLKVQKVRRPVEKIF